MPGFLPNGAETYADVLRAQYEATRLVLESQLAACGSQAEREALEQQLKDAKADYKRRRRALGYSLFGMQ